MKYRYFNPEEGETIDDAELITVQHFTGGKWIEVEDFTNDVERAAEAAAEQYQPYAKWHTGSRIFAIADEQGQVTNVSVEIEYTPTFTAHVLGNSR